MGSERGKHLICFFEFCYVMNKSDKLYNPSSSMQPVYNLTLGCYERKSKSDPTYSQEIKHQTFEEHD